MKRIVSLICAVMMIFACTAFVACTKVQTKQEATYEEVEAFFANKDGLADVVTYKIKGKTDYVIQKTTYKGYCVCEEGSKFTTQYKSRFLSLPTPYTGMNFFEIMSEKGVVVNEDGNESRYIDINRFNVLMMKSKKYKVQAPLVFQASNVQYYLQHYILAVKGMSWTSLPDAQGEVEYKLYIDGDAILYIATDVLDSEIVAERTITLVYDGSAFKSIEYKHESKNGGVSEEIKIEVCKQRKIDLPDNPEEYKGTVSDYQ